MGCRTEYPKIKRGIDQIERRKRSSLEQKAIIRQSKIWFMQNQTKMENQLLNIQYQMDELLLSHDSGKSMEDRLKNDLLFYKKRIFDCNL